MGRLFKAGVLVGHGSRGRSPSRRARLDERWIRTHDHVEGVGKGCDGCRELS